MPQEVYEGSKRLNFTATTTALSTGNLLGILVASSTAGTIRITDLDGVIVNTMAVMSATFYRIPCSFRGGMTITVTGTLDATVFYRL